MDRECLTELIFDKAKENGIDDIEAYIVKNSSMNFNIYEGDLEGYNIAEENALSLRGIYNGRMGYSYSEKLTEASVDELIKNLTQYAQNNDSKEVETFQAVQKQCIKSENRPNKLSNYTEKEKIDYMKSIEKETLNFDKRVSVVDCCRYEEYTETVIIKNAKGLELEAANSLGIIELSLVTKDDNDVQTGYSYLVIDDLLDDYKNKLIKNAACDGIDMLGATSIDSGNFEIILRNNVASNMLSYMCPIFLGNVVQSGLSMLKDKIGQKIGTDSLNILDNPLMEKGRVYRTFDDEGVATYKKHVVENGVLKTFLHNIKTAQKDGSESTGNGFRVSHKNGIDVLPTNMYIEEGKTNLEEMISSMDKGIIITDVQGLFAGVNAISGDFSLSSSGFLIKDGKIDKPLCQITISGNFYKLLKDITIIGNDTMFSYPGSNYFGSPSLKIKCLTVAGK